MSKVTVVIEKVAQGKRIFLVLTSYPKP